MKKFIKVFLLVCIIVSIVNFIGENYLDVYAWPWSNKCVEDDKNMDIGDEDIKINIHEYRKILDRAKDELNFCDLPEPYQEVETLPNGLKVVNSAFKWNEDLNLTNKPDTIFLHHTAISVPGTTVPVTYIHQLHLNNGWAGIGYHFYVTKDGTIFRGRPENAIGAQVKGHNVNSLGIAAEGMYNTEIMPEAQKKAIIELGKYLREKYKINNIYGHREKGKTDCPGKNYPLDDIRNAILSEKISLLDMTR